MAGLHEKERRFQWPTNLSTRSKPNKTGFRDMRDKACCWTFPSSLVTQDRGMRLRLELTSQPKPLTHHQLQAPRSSTIRLASQSRWSDCLRWQSPPARVQTQSSAVGQSRCLYRVIYFRNKDSFTPRMSSQRKISQLIFPVRIASTSFEIDW